MHGGSGHPGFQGVVDTGSEVTKSTSESGLGGEGGERDEGQKDREIHRILPQVHFITGPVALESHLVVIFLAPGCS